MRRRGLSRVAVLAMLLAICSCAERVDVEAEKATIQADLKKGFEAVATQDWETLKGLTSENWVIFNQWGKKWKLEDMQSFFQEHVSELKIELSEIQIRVSGDGKLAWATFAEQATAQFDGNPVQEKALLTALFEKVDTDWKMVHLHRSAQPPPSPAEE